MEEAAEVEVKVDLKKTTMTMVKKVMMMFSLHPLVAVALPHMAEENESLY